MAKEVKVTNSKRSATEHEALWSRRNPFAQLEDSSKPSRLKRATSRRSNNYLWIAGAVFLVVMLLVLLIALATISVQALRAATANPAETLRAGE